MSRVKVSPDEKTSFFFRITDQRVPLPLSAIPTSFQSGCKESDPAPNTYRDSTTRVSQVSGHVRRSRVCFPRENGPKGSSSERGEYTLRATSTVVPARKKAVGFGCRAVAAPLSEAAI